MKKIIFIILIMLIPGVSGWASQEAPGAADEIGRVKEIYETEDAAIRLERIRDFLAGDEQSGAALVYVYRIYLATLHQMEEYDEIWAMLPDYFLLMEERDPVEKAQLCNQAAFILAESLKYTDEASALGKKALDYLASVKDVPRGIPRDQWPEIKKALEASYKDTVGWAAYRGLEYDEAVRWLGEAAALLPGDENIRYHYGLALEKKERFKEAWEELLYARGYAFFESPDIEEALKRIEAKIPADWSATALKNKIKAQVEQEMEAEALKEEVTARPAPAFTLPGVDGREYSLKESGYKVLLIDFWATWCGPCNREMPVLEKFYKEFASRGAGIFGIAVDGPDTRGDVPGFVREKGVSFPVMFDRDSVAGKYGVRTIPALFIVDKNGMIRFVHSGYFPDLYKKLYYQVRYLLNEK
ncbi:MAG TPA: redoxin domain-containing protein [Candidatus Mcinerneyibacteriales bacterium]|nr:redoxin domain-containing protein [Candidatus Mcinerneyibacteriales bacterium]HPJ69321.1 redoxin domain-containing protein [Candidatus Mcinerneyibacteriales bacterium]HPQ88648.1 redoxin domain-containing protein [Candidatus Mcinerneyibacteriales bacterium]